MQEMKLQNGSFQIGEIQGLHLDRAGGMIEMRNVLSRPALDLDRRARSRSVLDLDHGLYLDHGLLSGSALDLDRRARSRSVLDLDHGLYLDHGLLSGSVLDLDHGLYLDHGLHLDQSGRIQMRWCLIWISLDIAIKGPLVRF